MSAYFCSSATFHLIATYAATVSTTNDLKTVWRQLIAENLRSLNYRYPHHQLDNVATAAAELALITDRPMLPLPAPGIIRSALTEYRYQASEHPEWKTSPTTQLVARLLATIEEPAAVGEFGDWYPVEELPQARLSDIRSRIEPEAGIPEAVADRSPQPPPLPDPAPVPTPDPMEAARAKLAAMFAMPAAAESEPEPKPEPHINHDAESDALANLEALSIHTRQTGLTLLLTLARVSSGHPDAARFSELAELIGASLTMDQRAWSSGKASENAAALRIVLDSMDGIG